MNRVCHVTSVHPRYDVRIFLKECVSLAKAGYEVTLLCADNLPAEIRDGVTIKSVDYFPSGRIKRILGAKKAMLKGALEIDADIYHLHDPELLPVALSLKNRGKIVIFDSHEDYPLNIFHKEWIPKLLRNFISWLYSIIENRTFKKVDAVISVTPQMTERIRNLNKNSILITNYPLLSYNFPKTSTPKFNVCFAGVIAENRLHHNIIKALDTVPNLNYLLAGWSNEKYLNRLKKLSGWSKVKYFGPLSFNEVNELYKISAVGIVLEDYSSLNYGNQGSLGVTKLFEYMGAGIAVICTDFDLHKEIVEKNQCGLCVKPYDIDAISDALNFLSKHPDKANEMGEKGREAYLREYNWNTQEQKLLKLYSELFKFQEVIMQ